MSDYVRYVSQPAACPRSRLQSIDLELTERCDNDCVHCCINLPAGDAEARSREMSTDQVKEVLGQAAALGCARVRVTGGEPLLRPDFEEIYLFARHLGLRVVILTNARGITQRLAGVLRRVPPLEPLQVSVYGMREESYEGVTRVHGSFAEFRRGVDLLLERAIPFVVRGALLPPTRGEIEEFDDWARNVARTGSPPDYSMFFDLRSRRDDPGKNRIIESLRVCPEDGVAVLTRQETGYRRDLETFADKFMGQPDDRLFRCGVGQGMCVDAYGRAQACMTLRTPELTVDVLTRGVGEALESFVSLRDLKAKNPEYLRRCARCFLRDFCAQCPARSWAEHGTLDAPVEYFCRVAHAEARYMGWLGNGESAWESISARQGVRQTGRRECGGSPECSC